MDSDRKYRQNSSLDTTKSFSGSGNGQSSNAARPKPAGPGAFWDISEPRFPRLVRAVTASRCYSCTTTLPHGTVFGGPCPKCGAQLHCCKQCSHFEPSTRFQCNKPVPARIPVKDQGNTCALFSPRVTVAREASFSQSGLRAPVPGINTPPRNASDVRDAFDRLFKKEP